ncbi:MAG TPA: hypothetical protein VGR97_14325 [Candidatus Acidoferrales bacterium]|nr:hypothetical protein [Candidatus Acidoferrales bacterium]
MTQVISVITKDYALLASDRRLIFGEGSNLGDVADDDTCKLVSVCNICGVGYTGLARLEGSPTHEWIAKTLASGACREGLTASQLLSINSERIFSKLKLPKGVPQQFLIAGWGLFQELEGLHAFMRLVSNAHDQSGRTLPQPSDSFSSLLKVLVNETLFCCSIGQPLTSHRSGQLVRNLEQLVKREIGPQAALRLLVDEIVNTSLTNSAVGRKVLGFCIPKGSVERQIATGGSMALAKQPDKETVTFTYFEPEFNELRQCGPTFICGEYAQTDVVTENDLARNFQSSQFRILSMPKKKP